MILSTKDIDGLLSDGSLSNFVFNLVAISLSKLHPSRQSAESIKG